MFININKKRTRIGSYKESMYDADLYKELELVAVLKPINPRNRFL
jgi:hypothetical protein